MRILPALLLTAALFGPQASARGDKVAHVFPVAQASLTLQLAPSGTCLNYPAPLESFELTARGVGATSPTPYSLCLEPSPAWGEQAGQLRVKLGPFLQSIQIAGVSRSAPSRIVFQSLPKGQGPGKKRPVPPTPRTRGEGAPVGLPPGIAHFRVVPIFRDGTVYLTYEIQSGEAPGPLLLRADDLHLMACDRALQGYSLYRRSDDLTPNVLEPGEVQVGTIEVKRWPPSCKGGLVDWRTPTVAHPQRIYRFKARFTLPNN